MSKTTNKLKTENLVNNLQKEKFCYSVYSFTNIINGKKYIGLTCDVKRRYAQHKKGKSRAVVFCLAIKKYGFENFNFNILKEDLTLKEAKSFEQKQILELNTMVPNGYNQTKGGDSSIKHTEETILKIIEKNKIWRELHGHPFLGKKHSEEAKKLIQEAALKRKNYPAGINHWNYGKKASESTKEKIKIKSTLGNNGFAKKVIDLNTNIIYSCINEAKLVYNISHATISMICSGKRKSSKYNFMYLTDYDKNANN